MKKKFIMLFVLSVLCFILLMGCNDSNEVNNEAVTTEVESEAGRPQVIIPNGESYTIPEEEIMFIIPNNKEVTDVQNITYNCEINSSMVGWSIYFLDVGEDQETSFVVNYTDGTSEEFTLYITVE